MNKLALTVAAAAVACSATLLPQRGDAAMLPGADALRAAHADVDVTERVHCRPGRWHHRRGPHDGCFYRGRVAPRAYYYGPPPYDPYFYGPGPGYYGYGPAYYGPGYYVGGPRVYIGGPGFAIGIGPRWGW